MRYGICLLPDLPWHTAKPLWQRAEQLGFDHAWTYDHLVWGGLPDSRWFSCIPTLTAAAGATSTIKLGTFVASPNFRHPAAFAREVQTVSDISDGRLLLGLGSGGTPDDVVLGQEKLTPGQRVSRFQEFTTLLRRCLSEDHVTDDGEWFSTRDMRLVGGSVLGRVPLILAGDGPRSVRFAARRGDAWVTTGGSGDTLDAWFARVAGNRDLFCTTRADAGLPAADTYLSVNAAPGNPLASVGAFDEIAGRASDLGFSDVIVHWPRESEPYLGDVAVLEALAARGLDSAAR